MTQSGAHEPVSPHGVAADIVRLANVVPTTAIVLGSGLAGLASIIQQIRCWEFEELPGFARATAAGHLGRLMVGLLDGIPVVAMQGRLHFYEGHSLESIQFPIRVMQATGAKRLFLSNAAGGIDPSFRVGDLMLLRDHIDLLPRGTISVQPDQIHDVPRPAAPRLPLPHPVYDGGLLREMMQAARRLGLPLHSGVYAAVPGPNYETRAEIRMLRAWGVDAVGMSTVPEAVVAARLGMRVVGLSVITNVCRPDSQELVSESMVIHSAGRSEDRVASLVRAVVALPSR